jgi:hypothetical protein
MSDIETIKRKVKKLLSLSKSANENEAISALEKANNIMQKYSLDEDALKYNSVRIRATKTYVPWRCQIAAAVAQLYCCYFYRDADSGHYVFTGEELESFIAAEMYTYLDKSVKRIANNNIRKNAKLIYRTSFKSGMASRLSNRIIDMEQAVSWAPKRATKIEEAGAYVKSLTKIKNAKIKKIKLNTYAVNKGYAAADSILLARQAAFKSVPQLNAQECPGELFQ